MKINHRAVTSPVFELVKVIELDIRMSDEEAWTTRIELFREMEQSDVYRCRVWESEMFRLTPSFPRNAENEPAHVTDDTIMVERGIAGSDIASRLSKPFNARSAEAALEMVVEDLKKFIEHAMGAESE